jgi:hypothetical protein
MSRESRESKEGSITIHLAKGIFKDFKLSVFRWDNSKAIRVIGSSGHLASIARLAGKEENKEEDEFLDKGIFKDLLKSLSNRVEGSRSKQVVRAP